MISFATGISLAKGYPFVYSINPFLNERAVEQIKNGPAYNNTPMCILLEGHAITTNLVKLTIAPTT